MALYVVSMVLGASDVLSGGASSPFLVGGLLIGSIVILPRHSVPRNQETRQEASDEELEHFKNLRRWLTWTRFAYLAIAFGVLVGLPRLL